jgi:hypothetical protein
VPFHTNAADRRDGGAKMRGHLEDDSERDDDGGLQNGNLSRPDDQREGDCRGQKHDGGLDVVLHTKARIEPARQRGEIGKGQSDEASHERRFEAIVIGYVPLR